MNFPDIPWGDFTPECLQEWARLGITDEAGYLRIAHQLCIFCDKQDHWACKCPLAWSGTFLGIQRFGDHEASARVVKHRQEREARNLAEQQTQAAVLFPELNGQFNVDTPKISWDEGCQGDQTYQLLSVIAEAQGDETFDEIYERLSKYSENATMINLSVEARKKTELQPPSQSVIPGDSPPQPQDEQETEEGGSLVYS